MSGRLLARRIVLALVGIVFLAIAAASLVAPAAMAEPLGYRLDSVNAYNEFRAIYVGLWLAHAVLFAWAAWRIERRELGDVGALLLAGQVVGRLLSLALDGMPDARLLPAAIAELVGAVLIWLLRPASQSAFAPRHS